MDATDEVIQVAVVGCWFDGTAGGFQGELGCGDGDLVALSGCRCELGHGDESQSLLPISYIVKSKGNASPAFAPRPLTLREGDGWCFPY